MGRKILLSLTFFLVFVSQAQAHPGNTAADGCHYCRTNCDKWGVEWNERHCHGGGSAPLPSTPKPTPIPTPKPTSTPRPTSTPTPTTIPTDSPSPEPTEATIIEENNDEEVTLDSEQEDENTDSLNPENSNNSVATLGKMGILGFVGYKVVKAIKKKRTS